MHFTHHLDKESTIDVARISAIVFGKSAENYFPFLYDVFTKSVDKTPYQFMLPSEFEKISDLSQIQKIYWTELVYRAHLAAVTSLLRHLKWIDGILLSAYFDNWYSFASNFRGLLESCGDSVDALKDVPGSFANNFSNISTAIEGKADKVLLAKNLENKLIHFSDAHRGRKGEKLPPEQRVKKTAEYLAQLQGDSEALKELSECYGWLCQITHPAKHSVYFFFETSTIDDSEILTIDQERDALWIADFCKRHQHMMYTLCQTSFNHSLITLKIINRLPIPSLRNDDIEKIDFSGLGLWRKLEPLLKN